MKMKVLVAIERDILWFIVLMESYMQKRNQDPNSKDEKIISIFSPFRDRKANIVAYKCKVCNRKESHRFHWIIGSLNAKESRT